MSLEMMGITWNYKGNSQKASYQLYSYHCQAARFFSHSQDEDLLYVLLQQELRVFDLGDRPGEASKVVPRHLRIGDSMVDQQPVVIILVGGLEHIYIYILVIVTPILVIVTYIYTLVIVTPILVIVTPLIGNSNIYIYIGNSNPNIGNSNPPYW